MVQPRNLIFLTCLRAFSPFVMPFFTIAVFLRNNIFHLRFCVYNLLINLLWLLIRLTFGPGYLCNSRPLQDKSFSFGPSPLHTIRRKRARRKLRQEAGTANLFLLGTSYTLHLHLFSSLFVLGSVFTEDSLEWYVLPSSNRAPLVPQIKVAAVRLSSNLPLLLYLLREYEQNLVRCHTFKLMSTNLLFTANLTYLSFSYLMN